MNIFSRLKNAVTALLNRETQRRELEMAGHVPASPVPRHMTRYRIADGRPIFGPTFIPDGTFHHVSREACRHMLRAIQFQNVSARAPLATRRERRRMARLFACMEYRRMMNDRVNAIPDEADHIYQQMTHEELGVVA